MKINTQTAHAGPPVVPISPKPTPVTNERQIKDDSHVVADRFNTSKHYADLFTGFALGAVSGAVEGVVKAPLVATKIITNSIKAETIGPKLKTLQILGAIPGAAGTAIAAPIVQAFRDVSMVKNVQRNLEDGPLYTSALPGYTQAKFSPEQHSFVKEVTQKIDDFGAKKLAPGEAPHDVSLTAPITAVIGGVVSGIISGAVGLVAGTTAGLLTTAKEATGAIVGRDQSLGQRVGRLATAPLHTVTVPYGMVKEGLKESVPRGLSDGWEKGATKPIVDTIRASGSLAANVLKEAWER